MGNLASSFQTVRRFHDDQSGAAYSLSFVLILPFYVIFLCIVMEMMFLMVAKIGTMHAALAAARVAVVRSTVSHPTERLSGFFPLLTEQEAGRAAVVALVPYSSGLDVYKTPSSRGQTYLKGYKDFVKSSGIKTSVLDSYVLAKFASAEKRLKTTLKMDDSNSKTPWKQSVTAKVEYDAPFRLPYIGRILGGTKKNGAIVRAVVSEAILEIECPQNSKGFLGVPVPWDISW